MRTLFWFSCFFLTFALQNQHKIQVFFWKSKPNHPHSWQKLSKIVLFLCKYFMFFLFSQCSQVFTKLHVLWKNRKSPLQKASENTSSFVFLQEISETTPTDSIYKYFGCCVSRGNTPTRSKNTSIVYSGWAFAVSITLTQVIQLSMSYARDECSSRGGIYHQTPQKYSILYNVKRIISDFFWDIWWQIPPLDEHSSRA